MVMGGMRELCAVRWGRYSRAMGWWWWYCVMGRWYMWCREFSVSSPHARGQHVIIPQIQLHRPQRSRLAYSSCHVGTGTLLLRKYLQRRRWHVVSSRIARVGAGKDMLVHQRLTPALHSRLKNCLHPRLWHRHFASCRVAKSVYALLRSCHMRCLTLDLCECHVLIPDSRCANISEEAMLHLRLLAME